ncbi:MAG: glycosyltransferase family 4 protein [Verrucomicrobiales bacterium]|nr:glycosyltransferase family 4 protein [Verrucomicrobiales bacterium]
MKIALSTSVIDRGKSGVARYVIEITKAILHRLGTDQFILFVLEDDLPLFAFAEKKATIVPVKEIWRRPVLNIVWHQMVLPRLLSRHRVDLLHVPSYRRMVWHAPCRKVATIHDLAPFRLSGKYDFLRMIYGRYAARALARRQDAILTVSNYTASDIEVFFGIPKDRIHVAFNGLDHERFYPRTAHGSQVGRNLYFLYVSRLEHPAKNHVRLIKSFNHFKDTTGSKWKLVLAGGDWHGSEIIKTSARNSPHASSIELPGFVPDQELPELYRNAGAMVYPSLFEGFGLPPVEAMACGCPVISSDRGSLPEITGKAALLVNPNSARELESAMTRIATEASLRNDLTSLGVERSRCFDWNTAAEVTLKVFRANLKPPIGGIEENLSQSHAHTSKPPCLPL